MTGMDTITVGLDIGTTKVCVVVASHDARTNRVDIIGTGVADCEGLKRGVVTNISKTADAIKRAVEKAEQQSGFQIGKVVIGVSGDHIQTFPTRAIVTTSTHEITEADVRRLHYELRQLRITPDRRILHVIPQDYIIDDQDGISDPLGMSGKRLDANALVITASSTAVENIYRCADRVGLQVEGVVLQPLASAYAVLDEAEKEVGVALIDIGGGTTDIAVFRDNVLRFTSIIGIAGQKVTDDIVAVLGIRNVEAERIKLEYGHAVSDSIMREELFQVPGVGGRTPTEVSKSLLCQIIEPRMEEIYEFTLQEVMKSTLAHQLAAGVVITGGCALLRGSDALAQRVFRMPVKIGIPGGGLSVDGLAREVSNPMYATAVGLVLYAIKHRDEFEIADVNGVARVAMRNGTESTMATISPEPEPEPLPERKKGVVEKVKDWFESL